MAKIHFDLNNKKISVFLKVLITGIGPYKKLRQAGFGPRALNLTRGPEVLI